MPSQVVDLFARWWTDYSTQSACVEDCDFLFLVVPINYRSFKDHERLL